MILGHRIEKKHRKRQTDGKGGRVLKTKKIAVEHKKSKVTLKSKLALLIFITCILQLMFTTSGYLFVYGSLNKNAQDRLYDTFGIVNSYTDDLAGYVQKTEELLNQNVNNDLLAASITGNAMENTENELTKLLTLISLSAANSQIRDVSLYMPQLSFLASDNYGLQIGGELNSIRPVQVYQSLMANYPSVASGQSCWISMDSSVFYASKMNGTEDVFLIVELSNEVFSQFSFGQANSNHIILLMQDDRTFFSTDSSVGQTEELPAGIKAGGTDVTIGKTHYYILSVQKETLNFRLVYLVPKSSYNASITEFFMLSGVTLIINILIWVFFANSLILKTVYGPVMELVKSLEGVKNNEFDVILEEFNEREWDEVTTAFNTMVKRINENVGQMYQKDLLMKDIELKFLQSQINPHFLYNTLDTIASKASSGDVVDVNRITGYLSKMYKLVFNRGNDYLLCKDVMLCSEMYFRLCEFKYSNFRFKLRLDPAIANKEVLNLIVQTVAENALVHGYDSAKPHFIVHIRGFSKEDKIIFEVMDNGKGFNEEQLEMVTKIMQKENIRSDSGLVNVQKRLKLYYGPECGIVIKSRRGRYTKVIITMLADLPKRQDEEEEE